ncbi:MAG: flavodoxin family protein, partial [Desulfobacterales bacterium]|nr:flavodoxin family protein [Desulfobacterales bacterium]
RTETVRPHNLDIGPCKELIVCEKKGFCPIRDEMEGSGYRKLKQADAVVLATPVFFYGVSAQAKVFIDRCQMFWGRKYKLRLKDPDRHQRRGFLLSVAASAGKRLFEGVDLTTRYFYDAISTDYSGSLTYKKVEGAGDIERLQGLDADIRTSVTELLAPLQDRSKLIFISPGKGNRALMAAAFAKEAAKGSVQVVASGAAPPEVPATDTIGAMAESGLDVKYLPVYPKETIAELAAARQSTDEIILIKAPGEHFSTDMFNGNHTVWDIAGTGNNRTPDAVREDIAAHVNELKIIPSP